MTWLTITSMSWWSRYSKWGWIASRASHIIIFMKHKSKIYHYINSNWSAFSPKCLVAHYHHFHEHAWLHSNQKASIISVHSDCHSFLELHEIPRALINLLSEVFQLIININCFRGGSKGGLWLDACNFFKNSQKCSGGKSPSCHEKHVWNICALCESLCTKGTHGIGHIHEECTLGA